MPVTATVRGMLCTISDLQFAIAEFATNVALCFASSNKSAMDRRIALPILVIRTGIMRRLRDS